MNWSQAFARQACSDFEARDALLTADLPACHHLHYLQMAMEKVAKAHYMARGDQADALQHSHAYVAKAIPLIVRDVLSRAQGDRPGWIMDAVRPLANRIELLAPAANRDRTVPSNSEYPWKTSSGTIVTPCDYDFQINLHDKAAITMLKAVRARAMELAAEADS